MTDARVDILIDEAHEKARGMDDYALHRALVLAGCRARLEEVQNEMSRLSSLPDEERTHGDDWEDLQAWLDAKLKG